MKRYYLLIGVLLPMIMFLSAFKSDNLYLGVKPNDRVEIIFTKKYSLEDLVNVKRGCLSKHITISYKKIEFDENNQLKKIYFSVNCNDGFKGTAGCDNLYKTVKFGFVRNYSSSATIPFEIGDVQ
jgi:hypothetical protein